MRTGISLMARDDNNPYLKYSGLTSEFANFPLAIFKLSERYFLQAEAALRWNIGGSVNTNYLRGVAAMFDDYNIAQTDPDFQAYWNQESADTSIDYVDPYDSYNNIKGLVTVGVKINNSDDNKTKLEKSSPKSGLPISQWDLKHGTTCVVPAILAYSPSTILEMVLWAKVVWYVVFRGT